MWYVAQVQAGRESSTLEMCRRLVPPSVMEDCFMPEYESCGRSAANGAW